MGQKVQHRCIAWAHPFRFSEQALDFAQICLGAGGLFLERRTAELTALCLALSCMQRRLQALHLPPAMPDLHLSSSVVLC